MAFPISRSRAQLLDMAHTLVRGGPRRFEWRPWDAARRGPSTGPRA
jgi:hypothetical protein